MFKVTQLKRNLEDINPDSRAEINFFNLSIKGDKRDGPKEFEGHPGNECSSIAAFQTAFPYVLEPGAGGTSISWFRARS